MTAGETPRAMRVKTCSSRSDKRLCSGPSSSAAHSDASSSATSGAAELLGLSSETGTLDPGKSADLIAVKGDPLTDPAAVQHVDYVMVQGRPIPMGDK